MTRARKSELKDSYDTESLPELEKIIANDTDKSSSTDEYLREGSGFMEDTEAEPESGNDDSAEEADMEDVDIMEGMDDDSEEDLFSDEQALFPGDEE